MITNAESRQISPTEEKANKELVLKFYAEARGGSQEDLLAPDFVGSSSGVPQFNREGFLRALSQLYAAFPDGYYVNDDVIVEGDKVVTLGRFLGTHKGEFHGIPATGKRVTITSVHIDRVSKGKIVEHLRITDSAELMRQVKPESLPGS
jgi:predicted ester cyclase